MRRSKYMLLFIWAFALMNISLYSQIDSNDLKPKYGIFGNYNFNYHDVTFTGLPGVPSCCPEYSYGLGSGYSFGGLFDYPINYNFLVSLRIGYSSYSASFDKNETIDNIIVDGTGRRGEIEHLLDVSVGSIGIEPVASYRLTNSLFVHAGLRLSLVTGTYYDQIENIIDPPDRGTFADGRSFRNDSDGDIQNSLSFHEGLTIGTSYELQMNREKSLFLVPEVYYTYFFTPVISNYDWTIHNLSLGLAIKYRVPPPPPPPPPPPANPPTPELSLPAPPPLLSADIEAIEIDSLGNGDYNFSIKIEDFISLNMRPLLNYVFFDSNSAAIPDRYIKMNPYETMKFKIKDLQNLDAIQTYYQVLNIFGKRLRENPDLNITLVGANSNSGFEKNNKKLSRQRAESVRNYLRDAWGIDEKRMAIKARNLPKPASKTKVEEGRQENRRVEIISNNWALNEPVITIDTMRVLSASKIIFLPAFKSNVGLKSWEVAVAQNRKELISWSGDGNPPEELEWNISTDNQNSPKRGGTINYYLIVTDKLNQTFASEKYSLPVEQLTVNRKRLERRSDKEFEYYRLILFDYGKSKLASEHRKVVDIVKNRITPDAKVFIYGHTDRMGEEALNKRISTKRAHAVARRLKIPTKQVEGVGESQLLYDNSLPEGRFYCRTVRITIETPVREDGE